MRTRKGAWGVVPVAIRLGVADAMGIRVVFRNTAIESLFIEAIESLRSSYMGPKMVRIGFVRRDLNLLG